jgi:hypothetical protein
METSRILVHGCDRRADDSSQAEEFMAKRMGAEIRKVASSHAAMIAKPKEVSNLIMSAVESAGKSAKRTHISA